MSSLGNRLALALLSIVVLSCGTGCSSLKNTWNYKTTTVEAIPTPPPSGIDAAKKNCKTPLRVAVAPFSEDTRMIGDYGKAGSVGATFAGLVMAPPLGIVKEEAISYDQMSWQDMYGIALYAELVDSGCFQTVTWRPRDPASYDLVFDGSLRRFGNQKQFPIIPLPLFIGTAISLAAAKITFLNEWDIIAKRPDGKVVFMFGAEAACNGLECIDTKDASASRDLREQLRRGYTDFLDQLYGYVASRDKSYWEEAHRRTKERYFHRTDPELGALEAARKTAPAENRDGIDAEITKRRELLQTLWEIDTYSEDAWGSTSQKRVLAEVDEANKKGEAEYNANLKKAVIMAASGAVVLGSQIQSGGQIQPTFMLEVNAKAEAFTKDIEKIERWIELVKSIVKSKDKAPSEILGEIVGVLEKQEGPVFKRLAAARAKYTEIVGTSQAALDRIERVKKGEGAAMLTEAASSKINAAVPAVPGVPGVKLPGGAKLTPPSVDAKKLTNEVMKKGETKP